MESQRLGGGSRRIKNPAHPLHHEGQRELQGMLHQKDRSQKRDRHKTELTKATDSKVGRRGKYTFSEEDTQRH